MNIFKGYVKKRNSDCIPFEEMIEIYDLDEAKKECSDDPNCHMFFHGREPIRDQFWFCGKRATIRHYNNRILYQLQGNKP